MKLRPIHIWAPSIRLGSGGIQAFSRAYIRAIAEGYPNHRIAVLTKNEAAAKDDPLRELPNVDMHSPRRAKRPIGALAFAFTALHLALRDRPACIVSTHLHFLPLMSCLRFLTGAKILAILHGIDIWHLRGWLRRRAVRQADHLMAVSQFTRTVTLRNFHLPADRVSVVPNTFDEDAFQPGPKPSNLLERHGLSRDQPVLLTVGRLLPGDRLKGQRQTLVALSLLLPRFPHLCYLIAGSGPDLDDLKEAARSLGVANHVIFAGQIPQDDLPDYYRLADLFVMPCLAEGFGIVFLEAMASGRPVIAGNRDGSVDALDGGRLGALVDPFDASALARTIEAVLDKTHPNALLRDPDALHRAVSDHFGFKRVSQIMADALRPWVPLPDDSASPPLPAASTLPAAPEALPTQAFRVVVVTEFTSPYQIEFFNAIAQSGHCLLEVVYMKSRDATRNWDRPPIGHLSWILDENRSMGWEALKSVQEADLVVFNTYLFSFSLRTLWLRAHSGKPWAFWGERPGSLQTGRSGTILRRLLLHPLHQQAVPIWGMGQFGLQGYQAEYGVRSYHNFAYASDLSGFNALPQRDPHERVFLFSGNLTPRKGCDLLAQAFTRIAAKHSNARLVILGSGPLEATLRSILAGHAAQVTWLGFQSWDQLPSAFAQGTILCLPSRYDGWGLALVEGLAAGMPAIGTDQTGSAVELLASGDAGWLIAANDPAALEHAMEQALTLDADAFAAKQAAARQAARPYDIHAAVPRFLDLCRTALSPPL